MKTRMKYRSRKARGIQTFTKTMRRFLPGMTEVNITVVPKRMTKEAAVTDTPSSTEDYNPSDRLWLEADLDGGGLAGEDTWNTYQVWRYEEKLQVATCEVEP